jgi:hypothetical protein
MKDKEKEKKIQNEKGKRKKRTKMTNKKQNDPIQEYC